MKEEKESAYRQVHTQSIYQNEKTLLYTESQGLKAIKKDEHTVHIENETKSLNAVTLEPGIQQYVEKMSCTVRNSKIPEGMQPDTKIWTKEHQA